MRKIGIFGGSFNPIHCGHIALAKEILRQTELDEIWLMVSPQNPLKREATDLLDDDLRFQLAKKALEGVEGIEASDYEFHLSKPSYTWHTLQALKRDYPDVTFSLVLGGDNWQRFERWYHWKDILRHHEVVVYPREDQRGTIEAELLPISSTEIRERVRKGESIEGLVPNNIIDDVKRLYRA
ncbi:MAG: nicotinate (nicotinamide) nucleotide adenylyltransferase [Prevotella sp.]|nr:nicotinate (nicotinamide) nucleotide adenylyltransferase [Prevotella sp.]